MNDRELLELAAKAAGYKTIKYLDKSIGLHLLYGIDKAIWNGDIYWNPLIDDGDALRLAVKLDLGVGIDSYNAVCIQFAQDNWIIEQKNNDPYAATRRAIVRAAAEIGKEMK